MSDSNSTMSANTTFDPFAQAITLLLSDGTPFSFTVTDLDAFILYSVQISINYAAQLGASLLLLVVVALLTKTDKRSSPIFVLNCISLVLNFVRNLLNCLYFTGPFSEVYAYFAGDYSRVPSSSYSTSIAATVFTLILLVFLEASLCLQAQVVCMTLRQIYRRIILLLSLVIGSLAILFRLVLCIQNSRAILSLGDVTSIDWLASASNITASLSICWFCTVFVVKLGFALYQRRKLGVKRFGPMQIIFIMGCQTLIIPAIFSILQYVVDLPSMDSNVLTLVSIFLPLSSVWASLSITGKSQSAPGFGQQRKNFSSTFKSGSTQPLAQRKARSGPLSPTTSSGSRVSHSDTSSPSRPEFRDVHMDLEAQGMTGAEMDQDHGMVMRKV